MTESDLTCRFLEELKDAIQKWESGDKQPMVDLIMKIQEESFLDGCKYTVELFEQFIIGFLKRGGEEKHDR